MIPEIPQDVMDKINPAGCLLMTFRGSISHGMWVPESDPNSIDDIDLMGVYVEGINFYTGLDYKSLGYGGSKKDSQEYWIDQYDVVNYEIRKLFGLLLKGNPNVLMLLYLDPRHILFEHPLWSYIKANRNVFLSKKAFYSFGGYAQEQLRKMTSGTHQGYMGEKRKKLVEEYGYDTKNAAHLIRLLRMGVEYLKRGTLTVDRTNIDANELLSIKRGEWSLERVRHEAQMWDLYLKEQFEMSNLPEKPDFEAASILCSSVVLEYHKEIRRADGRQGL